MRPSTGIFFHLYESYKQNKAILAIIGKIQQPVLHDGKKMRFKKKSAIQIILQSFAMDLYIIWASKTEKKVAVFLKRT